ncbi:MAG TPA: hypothetical protein VE547_14950 [Mycobacteriales bacterium]|nr:hypothetical protein [Mycobacteriales bacterium]
MLTAVTGSSWEADLVAELDRADHGLTVVRRCVDLPELLSAAASGRGRVVLLSADLRLLDRDAVARLGAEGVAVVGLTDPGDGDAEVRLRRLGVERVLPADAGAAAISRAVLRSAAERAATAGTGDVLSRPPARPRGRGRVVAVWGPTGAPGRTTVAVGLADECARLGVSTILVDADVYGGAVAQVLGLLDESAGIAAACRAAGAGRLDEAALAGHAWQLRPALRVLAGIARPDRWPELAPAAMTEVLDTARHLAALTIVDCGFSLEQDEELSYDTAAPRRNGATLAVLDTADTVLCVGAADPVGLHRLVRGLAELRAGAPLASPLVVVNKVRSEVVNGDPVREVATALHRWTGITDVTFLPAGGTVLDAALRTGATLAEAAPTSPLRLALVELARRLAGVPSSAPVAGRRRLRRAGRRQTAFV